MARVKYVGFTNWINVEYHPVVRSNNGMLAVLPPLSEAQKMHYPNLHKEVERQRIARSIKQMRVGDIVEAWLDCTPNEGCTLPLPLIICALPTLNGHGLGCNDAFHVKTLFSSDTFEMRFAYQWRIVGHIDGWADLMAAEEKALVATHLDEQNSLSSLATQERY